MEIQHKRLADNGNHSTSSISDRVFARAKDALERAGTSLTTFGERLTSLAIACLEHLPSVNSVKQRLVYAAVICLALNSTKCGMSADFGSEDANTDATAEVRDGASDQADSDSSEVTLTDAAKDAEDAMDAATDADAALDGEVLDASDVQDGDVTDGDADADVVLPSFDVPTPTDARDVVEEDAVTDRPDASGITDAEDRPIIRPDVSEDASVDRPDIRDVAEEEASTPDSGVVSDTGPDMVSFDVPDVLDRPDVTDSGVSTDASDVSTPVDTPDVPLGGPTSCGPCVPYTRTQHPFAIPDAGVNSYTIGNYYVVRTTAGSSRFNIACSPSSLPLVSGCAAGAPSGVCNYVDRSATINISFDHSDPDGTIYENVSVTCRP